MGTKNHGYEVATRTILWWGVTKMQGTVLKGGSLGKVENGGPRVKDLSIIFLKSSCKPFPGMTQAEVLLFQFYISSRKQKQKRSRRNMTTHSYNVIET